MHTASSFALASVMAGASESLWTKAAYYSAATFVGLSRMVYDQHWASDVLLGAAIGELCGRIVARQHAKGKQKFVIAPIIQGIPRLWGFPQRGELEKEWTRLRKELSPFSLTTSPPGTSS